MLGELEQIGNGWQLKFRRELAHPPARVWKALTEPDELRKWFPDEIVVGDWRVGSRLEFKHEGKLVFDGEPPSDGLDWSSLEGFLTPLARLIRP